MRSPSRGGSEAGSPPPLSSVEFGLHRQYENGIVLQNTQENLLELSRMPKCYQRTPESLGQRNGESKHLYFVEASAESGNRVSPPPCPTTAPSIVESKYSHKRSTVALNGSDGYSLSETSDVATAREEESVSERKISQDSLAPRIHASCSSMVLQCVLHILEQQFEVLRLMETVETRDIPTMLQRLGELETLQTHRMSLTNMCGSIFPPHVNSGCSSRLRQRGAEGAGSTPRVVWGEDAELRQRAGLMDELAVLQGSATHSAHALVTAAADGGSAVDVGPYLDHIADALARQLVLCDQLLDEVHSTKRHGVASSKVATVEQSNGDKSQVVEDWRHDGHRDESSHLLGFLSPPLMPSMSLKMPQPLASAEEQILDGKMVKASEQRIGKRVELDSGGNEKSGEAAARNAQSKMSQPSPQSWKITLSEVSSRRSVSSSLARVHCTNTEMSSPPLRLWEKSDVTAAAEALPRLWTPATHQLDNPVGKQSTALHTRWGSWGQAKDAHGNKHAESPNCGFTERSANSGKPVGCAQSHECEILRTEREHLRRALQEANSLLAQERAHYLAQLNDLRLHRDCITAASAAHAEEATRQRRALERRLGDAIQQRNELRKRVEQEAEHVRRLEMQLRETEARAGLREMEDLRDRLRAAEKSGEKLRQELLRARRSERRMSEELLQEEAYRQKLEHEVLTLRDFLQVASSANEEASSRSQFRKASRDAIVAPNDSLQPPLFSVAQGTFLSQATTAQTPLKGDDVSQWRSAHPPQNFTTRPQETTQKGPREATGAPKRDEVQSFSPPPSLPPLPPKVEVTALERRGGTSVSSLSSSRNDDVRRVLLEAQSVLTRLSNSPTSNGTVLGGTEEEEDDRSKDRAPGPESGAASSTSPIRSLFHGDEKREKGLESESANGQRGERRSNAAKGDDFNSNRNLIHGDAAKERPLGKEGRAGEEGGKSVVEELQGEEKALEKALETLEAQYQRLHEKQSEALRFFGTPLPNNAGGRSKGPKEKTAASLASSKRGASKSGNVAKVASTKLNQEHSKGRMEFLAERTMHEDLWNRFHETESDILASKVQVEDRLKVVRRQLQLASSFGVVS